MQPINIYIDLFLIFLTFYKILVADFVHSVQLTEEQPYRNSLIGTPFWMAPEVIKCNNYDTKVCDFIDEVEYDIFDY